MRCNFVIMRFEYVLISPYTFVSYLFLSLYFSLRMFSDPSRVAASRSRQICAAGGGASSTRLESKARDRRRRESVTFTTIIISCQCGTESFSSLHSYTVKNEILNLTTPSNTLGCFWKQEPRRGKSRLAMKKSVNSGCVLEPMFRLVDLSSSSLEQCIKATGMLQERTSHVTPECPSERA